jgi:DNA mismatch repair ATPase MutS
VRAALVALNRQETAELAELLYGPRPAPPARYRLFYVLSALSIACPLGMIISPWFVFPSLGLWTLNMVIQAFYGRSVARHANALKSLAVLLGAVPRICEALGELDVPEADDLRRARGDAQKLQKEISRAFLRNFQADDLTRIIIEYLDLLCLFELSAGCRALQAVNRELAKLTAMFRAVARLDALQGLAGSLSCYPSVCVPELQAGRRFSFVDVYHPLLDHPVTNTLEGTGNSLLLSGTNMSGKTTFIKTLGINLVLGQTLGFCLATRALIPPARVRTLIERRETITAGQSYFFFEAVELLRMLEEADRPDRQFWFVLDEVFRGTNAVERVAAGAAVLKHLNRRGFVVASTHDHQLADLLRDEFDCYHFSEKILDNEARFDYQLRKGPCTTRNAIRLLALAGYPKSVVDLAGRITGQIEGASS